MAITKPNFFKPNQFKPNQFKPSLFKSSLFKPSLLSIALLTAGMSANLINAAEVQPAAPTAAELYALLEAEGEAKLDSESKKDADDEAEEEGETLIVTGYRGSLLRSLNRKRNADTITEQVTADDLGALPDVSIADALTRLPGVAAVRTGGKASEINIRGLSGIFVHTTLNGREQVSTSGSRSVEFAQYPAELVSGATIYKTQKASLIEGGVAGTVDLQTASPLSNQEKHTFNINARGMFNDRADEIFGAQKTGNRFSVSYQGKFMDDTVGIALGYARLFQPSVATQFIGFSYSTRRDVDNLTGDIDGPIGEQNKEFLSEGFEMQHKGGKSTRDGYVAAIEWAPNDTFLLKADMFISKFDEEAFARGFRVKFDPSTANIANAIIDDNAVIGADFTRARIGGNTRVELVNDNNVKKDDSDSFGINAEWQLTDQFILNGDISRSAATSNFRNGLLWGLVAEDATTNPPVFDTNVAISYRLNGLNLPDVGFNQNFSDLSRVMLSKYGVFPFEFKDELNAIRFDGIYETRDNEIISSFQAGIRYSERQYRKRRSVFQYGLDNGFSTTQPPLQLNSSLATVQGFSGAFSGFPNYLAIDYDAALSTWFPNGVPQPVTTWGADVNGVVNNSTAWSVLESGQVWEDVLSGYFLANIDTDISNVPLSGNIGVRVVSTDQSATALVDVAGDVLAGAQNIIDEAGLVNSNFAPRILGTQYTNVLPQLNLNFSITENSQIRFAAARVLARSEINRLSSNTSTSFEDDGKAHVSSVNSPFLKPFLANQYDLSYEYYFTDTEGAFVVAVFQKDLKNFVQTFTDTNFDFEANGITLPEYVPGFEPGNANSNPPRRTIPTSFTAAVNNSNGGYFRGIEIAYTQVFTNLPDFWSGLGVSASYAYTETKIDALTGLTTTDLGGSTVESPFPGLSRNVINAAIFWGYEGFDTRLNVRRRSRFVSSQFAVDLQQTFFDSETVLDYQASYKFNDNFSALFQVVNLTDAPTKSFFAQPAQTGTIQFFGRQFFLGANYRM